MIALLLLVSWVSWGSCEVAVQDLLSLALSPALLEAPGLRPAGSGDNQSVTHGDLTHALGTMLFHRSMMNEYLCHNFVAGQILDELRPLERRDGEAPGAGASTRGGAVPRDRLLADPGSSGYKDWLEKSSGMETIYGQANPKGSDLEGYETGDVTGYATVQGGGGAEWTSGAGGGWSGGGWSGGVADSGGQGWHDNSGSGAASWGWDEPESGKGLALKDLFDLALTALALLAFKVFALQLIMTCFAKTPHMTVVMEVTTTAATAETRAKRQTNQMNELAYRVLSSVDCMMELQHGSCLRYTLCDNNKYSRALNNNNRLWLPLWSLGVSWMAGLWDGTPGIENVKASVLGLGNANCAAIYPQNSKHKKSK